MFQKEHSSDLVAQFRRHGMLKNALWFLAERQRSF